jgi:sialic acid synthase SpsE
LGISFVGVEYGYGSFREFSRPAHLVAGFSDLLVGMTKLSHDFSRPSFRREKMINRDIFEDLFVLELANNHWGDVQRGLKIIKEFGTVVRYNDVHAAIKMQFRDVDTFIHKDFLARDDIRYIKKTLDTRLSREDLAVLVEAVRRNNCVRLVTPFDEKSVELCMELGVEIIKVASSDVTDWPLLEKIAKTRKPVVVSTGGTSLNDIDNMVMFFEHRNIPLAINHCVSIYPAEDADLQLNQIDFLKHRYPGHVIGLSTHEYHDWRSSIMIAYAKGARTFERHIDIKSDDRPTSPYCSTPEQIAEWFQAFKKAKEICGASGTEKVVPTQREIDYLTTLVRGVYARRDLPAGHVLTPDDFYLAIPLQKGQLSCRELLNDQVLSRKCKKDAPLMVDMVDSLYNRDEILRKQIYARGF